MFIYIHESRGVPMFFQQTQSVQYKTSCQSVSRSSGWASPPSCSRGQRGTSLRWRRCTHACWRPCSPGGRARSGRWDALDRWGSRLSARCSLQAQRETHNHTVMWSISPSTLNRLFWKLALCDVTGGSHTSPWWLSGLVYDHTARAICWFHIKETPAPPFEHAVGASQWKAAKTGLNTHLPTWARWGCVGCESRRRPAWRRRSRPHPCSVPGPDAPAAAGGAAVAAGWPRPPPGRRGGASSCSSAGCGTTPSLGGRGGCDVRVSEPSSDLLFDWIPVL